MPRCCRMLATCCTATSKFLRGSTIWWPSFCLPVRYPSSPAKQGHACNEHQQQTMAPSKHSTSIWLNGVVVCKGGTIPAACHFMVAALMQSDCESSLAAPKSMLHSHTLGRHNCPTVAQSRFCVPHSTLYRLSASGCIRPYTVVCGPSAAPYLECTHDFGVEHVLDDFPRAL